MAQRFLICRLDRSRQRTGCRENRRRPLSGSRATSKKAADTVLWCHRLRHRGEPRNPHGHECDHDHEALLHRPLGRMGHGIGSLLLPKGLPSLRAHGHSGCRPAGQYLNRRMPVSQMPSHLSRRFPILANNVEHVLVRSAYEYVEAILEPQAIHRGSELFSGDQRKSSPLSSVSLRRRRWRSSKASVTVAFASSPAPCPRRRDIRARRIGTEKPLSHGQFFSWCTPMSFSPSARTCRFRDRRTCPVLRR